MAEAIKVLAEGERDLDITMIAYFIIAVTIVSKVSAVFNTNFIFNKF